MAIDELMRTGYDANVTLLSQRFWAKAVVGIVDTAYVRTAAS